MLSNTNYIAWDFTNSLTSNYGQSETWALNDGAVRTNLNGIELLTTSDDAQLACTNGGILTGWTYPFTVIAIFTAPSSTGASVLRFFNRRSSGDAELIGGRYDSNASQPRPTIRHNTQSVGLSAFTNLAYATEQRVVLEFRANGGTIWVNNAQVGDNTAQSNSMPSLATTDSIWFGAADGSNINLNLHGAAFVNGTISSTDRSDIETNWRTALGPATASARFRPYFITG